MLSLPERIGTIPAGVPLHSHADAERFFTVFGTVQVLSQKEGRFEWLDVKPGDFIQVPCGAKHAFRNNSSEPVVQIVMTTPPLGRFFREVGKRVTSAAPPLPPTPEELRHFVPVSDKDQYWMARPKKTPRSAFHFSKASDWLKASMRARHERACWSANLLRPLERRCGQRQ